MTVTIELADLCEVFGTAKLYDHVQRKAEAAEKKNAELVKECETQALEINQLRCRIMEAEKPRELQPVTVTAISNAKEVLDRLFRPFSSEEDAANETVPGDHFHTVYNALRDLVSRLEQEGLS